eukprot:GFYU01010499.1.p1 GENE.GFYU01010499.1~~GFYU01010499.1.p1  ORF type:complete len:390 (+),score=76.79 GFYU01010499.1:260-1429(+)
MTTPTHKLGEQLTHDASTRRFAAKSSNYANNLAVHYTARDTMRGHSGAETPPETASPPPERSQAAGGGGGASTTSPRFVPHVRKLKVFVGTWNMMGAPPPEDVSEFIAPRDYDVVAIGSEECERSIEKSLLIRSKDRWEAKLKERLGDEMVMIRSHNLVAIHLALFIRKDLQTFIRDIDSADVATGIGDVIGNKGGVAITARIGDKTYAFVNAHFAAHQEKVRERQMDYMKISLEMPLPRGGRFGLIKDRFDYVFFSGDLNYRIDATRALVDACVDDPEMMEVLQQNDQLRVEMEQKRVFDGYREGEITFRPTYKYDPGTDQYDTKKMRVPGWTDRVLYKECPQCTLLEYDHTKNLKSSDHKPVWATFETKFVAGAEVREGVSQACTIL